ncbi:MAG: geranylgeranyl reductase family protein [Acidimicrobiales bacterium]
MNIIDAVVVGAGPAGCAAAITLAQAGRSVVVVDKATFPRDKFCGDGLTAGALRHLEALGLDPIDVPSWHRVDDIIVRGPNGHEVEFPLPRNQGEFAVVARRMDLDYALVKRARRAGATIHDGHAFNSITVHDDHVEVLADGLDPIRARFAIGADGMWSPLRKALGAASPHYLGEWHAFRQYFTNVTGSAADKMIVWFEPSVLPGYVWSFPLGDGRANVGFGITRDASTPTSTMKAQWPALLATPHIAAALGDHAVPESPHRAWPIPARIDKVALTAPRTLFVGDAAAATDVMTGEGIAQALLTGELAARAVISGATADGVRARYEESIKHALFADHRMSVVLQSALARPRALDAAVRVAGLSGWTRRNFARWLFEDYPRALLLTPRRWHRHMFGTAGAYR